MKFVGWQKRWISYGANSTYTCVLFGCKGPHLCWVMELKIQFFCISISIWDNNMNNVRQTLIPVNGMMPRLNDRYKECWLWKKWCTFQFRYILWLRPKEVKNRIGYKRLDWCLSGHSIDCLEQKNDSGSLKVLMLKFLTKATHFLIIFLTGTILLFYTLYLYTHFITHSLVIILHFLL